MDIKRMAIGTVALFVVWSVIGFLVHGVILAGAYASSPPGVFRDMADMRMGLSYLAVAVGALGYTLLYGLNAPRARMADSLLFGLWFGLAAGFGMGFGTYSTMPISLTIAWVWFLGSVAEYVVSAAVLHVVFRPRA
jgi:hypothetical protein